MANNFDNFTHTLFNEAKFLLEKAKLSSGKPDIESAYLHSSLLLGMSALEAYVNGISLELIEGGFELNLNEKALISEKDIIFNKGTFQLGTKLKMHRLIDRIDFIYCKYSNKSISTQDIWNQNIKQTIKLRNDLVHPKSELTITYSQVESALQNILQTIDVLYKAVYKTHVPIFNYDLLSTLTE